MRALQRIDPIHARGATMALGAALLFGASTPFSKLLLREMGPLTLAGILYAGAGATLLSTLLRKRRGRPGGAIEAALRPSDLPVLSAAILCGSVLGPALMMFGLERTTAVTGSLLLNLEPPLTIVIAVLLFREHLGRLQAGAAVLILAGTVLVGYRPGELASQWPGMLAVGLACLAWSIDTNLNQRLSLRDPVALGGIKGIAGGAVILTMAALAGEARPAPRAIAWALVLGAVAYGASMVLFFRGLRELGAARVAAYFATAPFAGALTAVLVLRETLRTIDLFAMFIMAAGVALLLRETHEHEHVHEEMFHDHAHTHDEHHRHEHAPGLDGTRRHAHPHRHAPLVHTHPHVPDLHHRHSHQRGAESVANEAGRRGRKTDESFPAARKFDSSSSGR